MYNSALFNKSTKSSSKRIHRRFYVNQEFYYSLKRDIVKCIILNISQGGMCLKVPQIFRPDDLINLHFSILHDFAIVKARIVHCNNNMIGVAYKYSAVSDYETVKGYMQKLNLASVCDPIKDIRLD